jgi:hypothetical protein
MRYIYDVYDSDFQRIDTVTKFVGLNLPPNGKITVTDMLIKPPRVVMEIYDSEGMEAWQCAIERANAWKPFDPKESEITMKNVAPTQKAAQTEIVLDKKDHINPTHYQSYFSIPDLAVELQWLETKQYQNHWKDPVAFKAAVLLQADKYLSRLGGKDAAVQEILKGIWYLKFLAAYIANGNKPIYVKDIESILERAK